MVAADTRISQGYSILSRDYSKTTKLTDKCVITSCGMVADIETLHKNLIMRVKIYEREHKRQPDTESLAQLLGNTLYGRRFFPYYAFNVLAGITKEGEGVCYGYDAIGSFDSMTYGTQGSGQSMASPLLDNQFVGHNCLVKKLAQDKQSVEDAAKDIINSIAERDIYTGDGIELCTVDSKGVSFKREACRRD
jgi:20S proteasome subunit beta 6